MSLIEAVQEWRTNHWREYMPAEMLREFAANNLTDVPEGVDPLRHAFTSGALAGADLRRTVLAGEDVSNAKLAGVRLSDSDLKGANFTGADLKGANLKYTDLRHTVFESADLSDARMDGARLHSPENPRQRGRWLTVEGMPSGTGWLDRVSTREEAGWSAQWEVGVGCWTGTVAELRELIAQDEDWPEATEGEIPERRVILEAFCDLVEGIIALW